jgi:hypothetical protein
VSENGIIEAIAHGEDVGRDAKGNRLLAVQIEGIFLRVVVDERRRIVITIWRES